MIIMEKHDFYHEIPPKTHAITRVDGMSFWRFPDFGHTNNRYSIEVDGMRTVWVPRLAVYTGSLLVYWITGSWVHLEPGVEKR
jgi:hypothetical protein